MPLRLTLSIFSIEAYTLQISILFAGRCSLLHEHEVERIYLLWLYCTSIYCGIRYVNKGAEFDKLFEYCHNCYYKCVLKVSGQWDLKGNDGLQVETVVTVNLDLQEVMGKLVDLPQEEMG